MIVLKNKRQGMKGKKGGRGILKGYFNSVIAAVSRPTRRGSSISSSS